MFFVFVFSFVFIDFDLISTTTYTRGLFFNIFLLCNVSLYFIFKYFLLNKVHYIMSECICAIQLQEISVKLKSFSL